MGRLVTVVVVGQIRNHYALLIAEQHQTVSLVHTNGQFADNESCQLSTLLIQLTSRSSSRLVRSRRAHEDSVVVATRRVNDFRTRKYYDGNGE